MLCNIGGNTFRTSDPFVLQQQYHEQYNIELKNRLGIDRNCTMFLL